MSAGNWGLLGALCGMAVAAGIVLMVVGWRPAPPREGRRPSAWTLRAAQAKASLPERWADRYRWLVIAGGVTVVAVWALTGIPLYGVIAAAVVMGFPWVWYPAGTQDRQIERLDAVAEWLQQLAGNHEVGTTLESAIEASARRAPQAIAEPVRTLAARLRIGVAPERAYRQFADDLADGTCDNVTLVFLTHARGRGRGLSSILQDLSKLTAEDASELRQIDAERAKSRTQMRWVAIICLSVASYTAMMGSYSETFYSTALGQLVLALLAALFVGAVVLMRRIVAMTPEPRLLAPLEQEHTTTPAGA